MSQNKISSIMHVTIFVTSSPSLPRSSNANELTHMPSEHEHGRIVGHDLTTLVFRRRVSPNQCHGPPSTDEFATQANR